VEVRRKGVPANHVHREEPEQDQGAEPELEHFPAALRRIGPDRRRFGRPVRREARCYAAGEAQWSRSFHRRDRGSARAGMTGAPVWLLLAVRRDGTAATGSRVEPFLRADELRCFPPVSGDGCGAAGSMDDRPLSGPLSEPPSPGVDPFHHFSGADLGRSERSRALRGRTSSDCFGGCVPFAPTAAPLRLPLGRVGPEAHPQGDRALMFGIPPNSQREVVGCAYGIPRLGGRPRRGGPMQSQWCFI
jgi:hypothetical protein